MAPGVTVWRSVVELMVQMMGPTPKRKNEAAASMPDGQAGVATIVAAAATDTIGPSSTATPKGKARNTRNTREAASAPTTMPAP